MLLRLNNVLHSITPHLNDATNGLMNKVGLASVVTGGTNAIVTTAIETQNPTWMTISNAVAVVSIVGSVMFVIKLCADIYFAHRKDKREQLELKLKVQEHNNK